MNIALWDKGFYHFPRTIFVDSVPLKAQIEKVESEVFEIHQILGRKNPNYNRAAEEIEDAFQALETLRRMLQEKHQVFVNKARAKVIAKLKKRGHYTL